MSAHRDKKINSILTRLIVLEDSIILSRRESSKSYLIKVTLKMADKPNHVYKYSSKEFAVIITDGHIEN